MEGSEKKRPMLDEFVDVMDKGLTKLNNYLMTYEGQQFLKDNKAKREAFCEEIAKRMVGQKIELWEDKLESISPETVIKVLRSIVVTVVKAKAILVKADWSESFTLQMTAKEEDGTIYYSNKSPDSRSYPTEWWHKKEGNYQGDETFVMAYQKYNRQLGNEHHPDQYLSATTGERQTLNLELVNICPTHGFAIPKYAANQECPACAGNEDFFWTPIASEDDWM